MKKEMENLGFIFMLCFLVLALLIILNLDFTTRSVLEISPLSIDNGQVKGQISLVLKEGELIPADSIIGIKLNGQEKEIILSSLLNEESKDGNFYIENIELNSSGEG